MRTLRFNGFLQKRSVTYGDHSHPQCPAIVTVDREDRVLRGENILVQDNVIRYIGPEERPADRVIDASHCFVYPGLVNTHHHLYQTFTRNLPKVQKMELFPWLRTLYEIWRGLDEDCIYYSSWWAGRAAEIRLHHLHGPPLCVPQGGIGALHRPAVPGGGPAGGPVPRHPGQYVPGQKRRRSAAGRSGAGCGHHPAGQPEIGGEIPRYIPVFHAPVALAPCSPFSVTTDLLKQSAVLARSMGVRLHTHLCETKDEERFTLEAVGMRPLAYMESCGWLGEDVWYAHGIHFNDQELRLLAKRGQAWPIARCPT